jgi:acetyltransferase
MTTLTNPHHHPYAAARLRAGRRPPLRHSRQRPQSSTAPNGETIATRDGRQLVLRYIHPDDVVALQRGFSHLTPEEIRMRFLHPLTELPEPLAQRLCNLDPETEVAFVLVDPAPSDKPEIHAVARAHVDPVTLAAEFALVVQGRFAGQGLGTLLMRRLIDECRTRGAIEMWGDVLLENGAMLDLCHELGFKRQSHLRGDPGVARVTLELHCAD